MKDAERQTKNSAAEARRKTWAAQSNSARRSTVLPSATAEPKLMPTFPWLDSQGSEKQQLSANAVASLDSGMKALLGLVTSANLALLTGDILTISPTLAPNVERRTNTAMATAEK